MRSYEREITMTEPTFESLETVFPQIIQQMPDEFDSHEFILELAHQYQRLYVSALVQYVDNDRPFQTVHGEIARRLLKYPMLVTKIGERNSEDIFRQVNSAAVWRKAR
jgi:hypothetical protein